MANTISWEKNGVYWKYSGEVSAEEIVKTSTSIYGDPRFDDLTYKIVDFTDASIIKMTDDALDEIAFQHLAAELSKPRIKNAIIMTVAVESVERFASFFKESTWDVQIFQDIEAANEWLGREAA